MTPSPHTLDLAARLRQVADVARTLAESAQTPEAMLAYAARCVASITDSSCVIFLVGADGDALQLAAMASSDPEHERSVRSMVQAQPVRLSGLPEMRTALETGQPVLSTIDERATEGSRLAAIHRETDVRRSLAVALRARGSSLGIISVARHGEVAAPFTSDDVWLVQQIAAHAALALSGARLLETLYEEVEARRKIEVRLSLLADVARDLSAFEDETGALSLIAHRLSAMIGDTAMIQLVSRDDAAMMMPLEAVHDRDPVRLEHARALFGHGPYAMRGGLISQVVRGGAVFMPQVDPTEIVGPLDAERQKPFRALEIASLICVPMKTGARTIGVIGTIRKPSSGPYTKDDFELVQSLADRLALTLANDAARKAERLALERLADAHRVLFDNCPTPMMFIDAESVQPLAVNEEALRLYGYTREEFLSMTVNQLRPVDERRSVVARLQQLGDEDARGTLRQQRKDGRIFDIEYVSRALELRGRKGRLSVLRDLTERELSARLQAQLASIVDSSEDAIISKTLRGTITTWNAGAERMFGYAPTEIIGRPVAMLIPPEKVDEDALAIARLASGEHVDHFESVRLHKDGSRIDVSITLSPVRDSTGAMTGTSMVARDIGERRRLDEEKRRSEGLDLENRRIQEASRLKSEFLANMSHELRTPLNAIIGFTSLLHAGRVGAMTETQTEYIGDVLTSSQHLLQLINDVLDLAKVEAGKMELRPEMIELQKTATEVCDIVRGIAAEKRVRLVVAADEGLRPVLVDPRALKQILYNYLSNAIKFTPEQGRVTIRIVNASETTFRVEVEDSGIGIGAGDLDRLFIEFQQLDAGKTKHYQGTGLGLALVKRLVEQQGGTVGVRSELGKGSVFMVTLPKGTA